MTVIGTVASIRDESDGDLHVNLTLPAEESGLLDQANYTHEDGQLVTEIVPADQPGCAPGQPPRPAEGTYSYGICTGADVATPPIGGQVTVTGPYVLDTDHGWMEIHPVWSISVRGQASASSPGNVNTAPPAISTPAPAGPAGAAPSGAAWCQATASPSSDGYSGDYEVSVHSNQPDERATATDVGDTWSGSTDGSGYADIRLYHTSPGEAVSVTVGAASCSTSA
jgi:hypothetical protein